MSSSEHSHSNEIFKGRRWKMEANSIILSERQLTHHILCYTATYCGDELLSSISSVHLYSKWLRNTKTRFPL